MYIIIYNKHEMCSRFFKWDLELLVGSSFSFFNRTNKTYHSYLHMVREIFCENLFQLCIFCVYVFSLPLVKQISYYGSL